MVLTINELYQAAANGETSWEHALLLTGLLYEGGTGLEVSPSPENNIDSNFYKLRLTALMKHPNDNVIYKKIIKVLKKYTVIP